MGNTAESIARGGAGVLPTDTLYGLVASALNRGAVERLYALKGRTPTKPLIILIASVEELGRFGVMLTDAQRRALAAFWPGPTSIILPVAGEDFAYLHRGTYSLAFRLPDDGALGALLHETDPLVAPSANPEGLPPATTIAEARAYFGDAADFYVDGGIRVGAPSSLVRIDKNGVVTVLREGRGRDVE